MLTFTFSAIHSVRSAAKLVRLIAASCFSLLFLLVFGSSPLLAQDQATVQVNNLTHPDLAPSFLAGDTYQYIVSGPPNQPVYNVQNSGPMNQVGQTDGSGTYVTTGVEQPGWVGNYTQDWYVGNVQAAPALSFTVSFAAVVARNLTHPDLSPNFLAGDTYQYTVYGPPNQPVYNVQNGGPLNQVGQTDGNGVYVTTGVEQTAWIGSYTQVWSVGNNQASPALSFMVGQFSNSGTVTTTNIGYTSDGHLEGVSSLSINNGVVSTYSATSLDYTARLYYDSQTRATLFDERTPISQAFTPVNLNTWANLGAIATAWHDYDLQTDHYAIAYFPSGIYYVNPLYWGNDCYAESGDCTINGGGSYAYYVTVAAIYVGSTLANQTNVPLDGSLPPFNDSLYDNFLASSQSPYPTGVVFKASVTEWFKRLSVFATIAAIGLNQHDYHSVQNTNPIPFLVDALPPPDGDTEVTDPTVIPGKHRERDYVIKDILGRPWPGTPIAVREHFSDKVGPGFMPAASGFWYRNVSVPNGYQATARPLDQDRQGLYDTMTDFLALKSLPALEVGFIQYFYASDFNPPSWFSLPQEFSLPGIAARGLVVPLLIKDSFNKCAGPVYTAGQPVRFNPTYTGIDGGMGPGTGCAAPTH